MLYLPGIHEPDQQAAALFGDKPGTVVFAVAIGSNPNDKSGDDYRWWSDRGFRVIVRLNNGWKPDGTIPAPSLYEAFAQRCANYVAASQGCSEWIIGNEPNHEQERPQGQEIKPKDYARCFALGRQAIKRVQPHARVIIAAIAPWNQQSGDWLTYWRTALKAIAANGGADGIALHAYTHGTDPALVDSDHKVKGWFWHLRTFEDQLNAVPESLRHLPTDITEADPEEGWPSVNTGWVQQAMRRVGEWNKQPGTQKVRSVTLYRWPRYDTKYSFADKAGVQDDFREACKQGYVAPEVGAQVQPQGNQESTFIPRVSTGGDMPASTPEVPREITEDFKQRTQNNIKFANPAPGQHYFALIKAEYVPNGASRFGPDHHMLVEVLDLNGNRKMGQPVTFVADRAIVKAVDKQGGPYGVDFDMYSPGYGYGVYIGQQPALSDFAGGMGLGTTEQPDWKHHVDFYLVFEERVADEVNQPSAPQPQPTQPATVPVLAHPIADPAKRVITQIFGVNPDGYAKFGMAGHNGVDFAVPEGTPIHAVDDGEVMESLVDPDGYGKYVKLRHAWGGESLYAHLSRQELMSSRVRKGQIIGYSGSSGNSTGPHLHFGMRVDPYTRGYPFDGYTDPLPYLPTESATPGPFLPGQPQPVQEKQQPVRETYLKWFKQYGEQYAVEWHLLAALAYNESKFNATAISPVGAQGIMQFTPATWADMRAQIGVSDPLDPEQSIKAAAYYLAQIRSYLMRNGKTETAWMLAAYNWGIGRVLQNSWDKVPLETKRYIDLTLETSEALRRWEDGW